MNFRKMDVMPSYSRFVPNAMLYTRAALNRGADSSRDNKERPQKQIGTH